MCDNAERQRSLVNKLSATAIRDGSGEKKANNARFHLELIITRKLDMNFSEVPLLSQKVDFHVDEKIIRSRRFSGEKEKFKDDNCDLMTVIFLWILTNFQLGSFISCNCSLIIIIQTYEKIIPN